MRALSVLLFLFSVQAQAQSDHIIFISDSHGLGAFGDKIRDWLSDRKDTSFGFVASGGSAPLQWTNDAFDTTCGLMDGSFVKLDALWNGCHSMHTPTLTALWMDSASQLTRSTRTISIIALGTNFSLKSSRFKAQVQETQELVRQALYESEICIWIGPPNMKRSPGFDAVGVAKKYLILSQGVKGCSLIDSRELSHYPENTGDGVHYQWPGSQNKTQIDAARSWAGRVITKIEEILK